MTFIGKKKQKKLLSKELEAYEQAGLKLWLDGKPSKPASIANRCFVGEQNTYMRDFVRDNENHIIGIGFDFINN